MSVNLETLAQALSKSLGPNALLSGKSCAAYRIDGCLPHFVALPGNVQEVSSVLKAAHEQGAQGAPWGGGTQQSQGYPPERVDLVLSLERMTALLAYEPADMTLSVQAGCTLAALQQQLHAQGQMLPLDVPNPEKATIGGILATNTSGPRRFLHGGVRDRVIGIKVVNADGTVTKGGGMVVKNVSGYDMNKLYIGSLGTLGVIVEANLKVSPRPAEEQLIITRFPGCEQAEAMLTDLFASALEPSAIVIMQGIPGIPADNKEAEWGLAVYCEGTAVSLERYGKDIKAFAAARGASGTTIFQDQPHVHTLWQRITGFGGTAHLGPDEAVLKVSVRSSAIVTLLEQARTLAERQALTLATLADAGSGVVILRLLATGQGAKNFGDSLHVVQQELVARWRTAVVLACAPQLKRSLPLWGAEPAGLALMRTIKDQFDPRGILNRGRYIGGI